MDDDQDPFEEQFSKEEFLNMRNNLKHMIATSKKQTNDLQAFSSLQANYEIIKHQLVATEALATQSTEKFHAALNDKEIAEAELKQLQSSMNINRRKMLMLQEKADKSEQHEEQANHWRQQYDVVNELADTLDTKNQEVMKKYDDALKTLTLVTKQMSSSDTQLKSLKTANADLAGRQKNLDKYLKSAIKVIDALSSTSNLSKHPKPIKDLVNLFRRDDVRLFFNSTPWKNSSASEPITDVPEPDKQDSQNGALSESSATSEDVESPRRLVPMKQDKTFMYANELDMDTDEEIEQMEKSLQKTVRKSAKHNSPLKYLAGKEKFQKNVRKIQTRHISKRVVDPATSMKFPAGVKRSLRSGGLVQFPPEFAGTPSLTPSTSAGTGAGATIHGRKVKTVREQQAEMMKVSIKDKVALLRQQQNSIKSDVVAITSDPAPAPAPKQKTSHTMSEGSDEEQEEEPAPIVEPEIAVKRGRGRPKSKIINPVIQHQEEVPSSAPAPKSRHNMSEGSEDEQEEEPTPIIEPEVPVKRGRGRPRSKSGAPDDAVAGDEPDAPEAPIKRGRGRPRSKSKSVAPDDAVEETEAGENPDVPVKRGRGRPRSKSVHSDVVLPKISTPEEESTEETEKSVLQSTIVTKTEQEIRNEEEEDLKITTKSGVWETVQSKEKSAREALKERLRVAIASQSKSEESQTSVQAEDAPRLEAGLEPQLEFEHSAPKTLESSKVVDAPEIPDLTEKPDDSQSVLNESVSSPGYSPVYEDPDFEVQDSHAELPNHSQILGSTLESPVTNEVIPTTSDAPQPTEVHTETSASGDVKVIVPPEPLKRPKSTLKSPNHEIMCDLGLDISDSEDEDDAATETTPTTSVVNEEKNPQELTEKESPNVRTESGESLKISSTAPSSALPFTSEIQKPGRNLVELPSKAQPAPERSEEQSSAVSNAPKPIPSVRSSEHTIPEITSKSETATSSEMVPKPIEKPTEKPDDHEKVREIDSARRISSSEVKDPVKAPEEKGAETIPEVSPIVAPGTSEMKNAPKLAEVPVQKDPETATTSETVPEIRSEKLIPGSIPASGAVPEVKNPISSQKEIVSERVPETSKPRPIVAAVKNEKTSGVRKNPQIVTSSSAPTVPMSSQVKPIKKKPPVGTPSDAPKLDEKAAPERTFKRREESTKPLAPPPTTIPKRVAPISIPPKDDLLGDILSGAKMPVKKEKAVKRPANDVPAGTEPTKKVQKRDEDPQGKPAVPLKKQQKPQVPIIEPPVAKAKSVSQKEKEPEEPRKGRARPPVAPGAAAPRGKERVAHTLKAQFRQALDLKVAVNELEKLMEEKGIRLGDSIALEVTDAADVMFDFLRETSASDMWAVLKQRRVDGNCSLVNTEEENFLQVSASLIDNHQQLLELFIRRILAEVAVRDTLDSRQLGRLSRLFCHSVHFSETSIDEKATWMRRFVVLLLLKHPAHFIKSVAYCLVSDAADNFSWFIEQLQEYPDAPFATSFRCLLHADPDEEVVVNWLLNSRFQMARMAPPTSEEIKKAFRTVFKQFHRGDSEMEEVLKSSVYLAKTGKNECLEVAFEVLKAEMSKLHKQFIEPHSKEKELQHRTVFSLPTVPTKMTCGEAVELRRKLEWQKHVMRVIIDNPHKEHWRAVMDALKSISPQIVTIREIISTSSAEQLVEPDALDEARGAIEQLVDLISEFTNFPLKTTTITAPVVV